MNRIWTFFLFAGLAGCSGDSQTAQHPSALSVTPEPVDAELVTPGNQQLLDGPSVLMHENRFIWGGSVIRGDDGRYHMFFSTWDCGADSIPFITACVNGLVSRPVISPL